MSMLTTVAACSHGQPYDKPCRLCGRRESADKRMDAMEAQLDRIERILTSERDPASGEAGY